MRTSSLLIAIATFLGLAAAGCETTVNGRPLPKKSSGEFEELSPFTAEDIQQKIKDVPYLRGQQVVDASAEIAKIGPAAIPLLQEASSDRDEMRRVFAMNVMGSIGDRRALPALRQGTKDSVGSVRYEAARACMRLGDWATGTPILIDGLTDESLYCRALCNDALRRQTQLDFGFHPKGDEADRKKAVGRWREWWDRHEKATLDKR
jgi:hypothetical protein